MARRDVFIAQQQLQWHRPKGKKTPLKRCSSVSALMGIIMYSSIYLEFILFHKELLNVALIARRCIWFHLWRAKNERIVSNIFVLQFCQKWPNLVRTGVSVRSFQNHPNKRLGTIFPPQKKSPGAHKRILHGQKKSENWMQHNKNSLRIVICLMIEKVTRMPNIVHNCFRFEMCHALWHI